MSHVIQIDGVTAEQLAVAGEYLARSGVEGFGGHSGSVRGDCFATSGARSGRVFMRLRQETGAIELSHMRLRRSGPKRVRFQAPNQERSPLRFSSLRNS